MRKFNNSYSVVMMAEVLEGAYEYNERIASRIKPFIKPPALEICAGIENIFCQPEDLPDLTITDVNSDLVKVLRQKFNEYKNIKYES